MFSLKKRRYFLLYSLTILSLMMVLGCSPQNESTSEDTTDNVSELSDQAIINLEAFSTLYGYTRFFHPSDEVEEISWSDFVVYGTEKVLHAESESDLKDTLEDIFLPIAPSLVIYDDETSFVSDFEITDGRVVAWQHYGYQETGRIDSMYSSQRTHANVEAGTIHLEPDHLFDDYPKIGETIHEQISPALSVSIPLILNLNETGQTSVNNDAFYDLQQQLEAVDYSIDNDFVRLSSIITSWNVYQHFYPYFHVLEVDWEEELVPALHKAYEAETKDDYLDALMSMLEKTEDGHTSYTDPRLNAISSDLLLPFSVDYVENSLMITASDPNSPFRPGDTLVSIDDLDPNDWLEERKQFIPGSEQWKTYYSLRYLLTLPAESIVIERESENITVDSFERLLRPIDEFYRPGNIEEVADDIFYFNLNTTIKEDLIAFFDTNTTAEGLIFDLRGYPADMYIDEILGRLTEETVTGPIARIYNTIYPNRIDQTYSDVTVPIEPIDSMFNGEIVFLSYEGSISHPEFILTYVKNNNLGTIIGTPTAGSNGNISLYTIPPAIDDATLTMLEVLNKDELQTHVVGIEPDIYIERTLEGVINEEDEFINAAVDYITNQN